MNLPNALTLLRIFFVPLLVAALVQKSWYVPLGSIVLTNDFLALCIFLAAAATDLLDGYLARKWQQITTVGMLLDPIADKLLISAALISLVQVAVVPGWMTILIVGREFAISGLRSIAAAEGYVIKANDFGKAKLVTQVIAICLCMLSIHWAWLHPYAILWMWGVIVTSLLSAIVYFSKFWRMVDDQTKARRRREIIGKQLLKQRMRRRRSLAL
jgi:CDP-diacylglycerol--glycerol-3-phosphate 3-phosphatidyltransferase